MIFLRNLLTETSHDAIINKLSRERETLVKTCVSFTKRQSKN
ncbi:hypothetical protein SAMN02910298_02081 [Pseudobutyrivibrio sp. YE44]|nr:hypothetical protein SAMN02910298_02081 [Pseudobutyrivibrio sp. YE44]